MKIISIITVNRNNASGIDKTIRSVLDQTYAVEYIIIDGASTDSSMDLIKKYSSKINYWVSENDRGIYHAMNKGLEKATGKYIFFLNSGDFLFNNHVIEKVVRAIKDEDIIYGNIAILLKGKFKILKGPKKIKYFDTYQHNLPAQPATFIKTSLINKIGGFDESYKITADVAVISKLLFISDIKLQFLNIPISIFDTNGLSSEADNQKLIYEERRRFILNEHPSYLNDFESIYKTSFFKRIYQNLRVSLRMIENRKMKKTMKKIKEKILYLPLIKYLNGFRRKYLDKKQFTKKNEDDAVWELQFSENDDSFVFLLDNTTKIRLHKDSILSRFIYNGNFEKEELAFVKNQLKPGDIFIDIGSNIGLFSLIASKIIGGSGKVIAFEPSPITYSRLRNNIDLNSFTNIETRNIGLSDSPGMLKLNVSVNGHDAWNTFAKDTTRKFSRTVAVPVYTIDDQLKDIQKEKISLIKIDVEGWEKFVLNGAKNFLNNYSPTLMVELTESNSNAAGYNVHEIYDLLVEWGYDWYKVQNGKLIKEKRRLNYPDENLIAIKNGAKN